VGAPRAAALLVATPKARVGLEAIVALVAQAKEVFQEAHRLEAVRVQEALEGAQQAEAITRLVVALKARVVSEVAVASAVPMEVGPALRLLEALVRAIVSLLGGCRLLHPRAPLDLIRILVPMVLQMASVPMAVRTVLVLVPIALQIQLWEEGCQALAHRAPVQAPLVGRV